MAEEKGIRVEKPRSILKKEIQINPKNLLISLVKVASDVAFLQWDDLAENGADLLDSLGLEKTPGEVAGLLIVRSLVQAMQNLLHDNRELFDIDKPQNIKAWFQKLNESLETSELTIDADFFEYPGNLAIVQEAKTGFVAWLEEFLENPVDAQQISSRLPAYFAATLADQWVAHNQEYAILKEVLDTPFTQANRREQGWLRYRAWLQKRVEEPMFLEAFGLQQVYVPLRAYYEWEVEASDKTREREITEKKKYQKVVVKLSEELDTWLQEANKDDAIRLISGGPGSGKSSFGKIWAAQQAATGEIPVLFVPLHLFKLTDDLVKAVGDFVEFDDFLADNPLEISNDKLRLLIIFDGLDELSMQGKAAEETARQFIEEVRFLVTRFNQRKTRLQVLITGREVVIQANRSKFRQPQQLLYLLPYFVMNEDDYNDEQNLLVEDQRHLWWQNYGKAKGKNYADLPEELDTDNLVDITTQPLLNYLVALSFESGDLQFTADTNLNEIYAELLNAVYKRGYEKHGYRLTEGIEKHEFLGILEEIALACWHGNGRTTTVKEIEAHCDNSGAKQILQRFQDSFREDSRASITRLLTAFYFRESGDLRESEKTFEFTHKSFGEYLTAKRIVEEVRDIHEALEERKLNYRKGCSERDALVRWATICGASAMDWYLFSFVCNEMRLQKLEEVRQWQQMLCRLIEFLMVNGMPMEGLNPRPNFQEEMRQARNAEEALLAVLNSCARVTKEVSEINWHSPEAFGTWISRLQGQKKNWNENALALECLSFLSLQGCILINRDLEGANLQGTILEGANLKGANLQGTNLKGAYLKGAILYGANLQGAYLQGAILKGANLQGAILKGAILYGANLQGAILQGAILEGANLQGAILKGTNLQGANLKGANLQGANLKGAILQWANLEGAKLEGAILYGANLKEANLKGTILEGKDIDEITGRS